MSDHDYYKDQFYKREALEKEEALMKLNMNPSLDIFTTGDNVSFTYEGKLITGTVSANSPHSLFLFLTGNHVGYTKSKITEANMQDGGRRYKTHTRIRKRKGGTKRRRRGKKHTRRR